MSLRTRLLDVYRGGTPDVVPYALDLSHWFYHKRRMPWDLSVSYEKPEAELIAYHRKFGVGFYVPLLGRFYTIEYPPDVDVHVGKEIRDGAAEITWRIETPIGAIERTRRWHEATYAWAIKDHGVESEQDIRVLGYALSRGALVPEWDRYGAWVDEVGDLGVVYLPLGYSAIGYLMNLWMGVENTIYAAYDWPDTLRQVVDEINGNLLECIDVLASSPAEIIAMGDNFSGDTQPPSFFREWSAAFYEEAVRRLHDAGKFVAVHIDGRLRGALGMIRETGADCADAVTPTPMGDLTPEECRQEAGPDFILSGGVSPDLWLPSAPIDAFRDAVLRWLDLRNSGPRLIAGAGDQVPPGADEDRIKIMGDLVEQYGRY